jgi:F0F1-type ATP synthase delta subunit
VRDETVARSYAETLFELADRHDVVEAYGEGLETVARLLEEDAKFRLFLETPRIEDEEKKKVVRKVFGDPSWRPPASRTRRRRRSSGRSSATGCRSTW